MHVGPADAARWTDAGALGLLVGIDHDGLVQASLLVGQTLLPVAKALAERGDSLSLPLAVAGRADGLGWAVESLWADAAWACQSADVALASAVDGKGAGHWWRRGYDVHGVTAAGAALGNTDRVMAVGHPLTVHPRTPNSAYFEIVPEFATRHPLKG